MREIKRTILYEVTELSMVAPEIEKEYNNGWRSINTDLMTPECLDSPITVEIEYVLI